MEARNLRPRTPMKGSDRLSGSRIQDYEEILSTPIRGGRLSERAGMMTPSSASKILSTPARTRRTRSRTPQEANGPPRPCSREGDCSDMDEDDDDDDEEERKAGEDPPSPSGSNRENEEEGRSMNESVLSRNTRRLLRSSAYACDSEINDKDRSVKCTIRRTPISNGKVGGTTPQSATTTTTPGGGKRYPLRESVRRSMPPAIYEATSSDEEWEEEEETPKRPRRRNGTYFSKADWEAFKPEEEEDSGEEEEGGKLLDEESSDDDDDEMEVNEEATPTRRHLSSAASLAKMVLTPEVLQKVEGRAVKRRLVVDSPVATGSQTMSPNPEAYFLADTRIKYKKISKAQEQVMNDAMKGKRLSRRKRLMVPKPGENLPEMMKSNFSVTTEAMRAQVETEDFIDGNTHDEEVERLLRSVKDNEFPHWLGLFRDDFNVMLYGYGSKLGVMREFENYVNDKYLVVTINGLFPKLNPRKLVHGLFEHVNPEQRHPTGSNIEALARDVANLLRQQEHPDIFILINNFDNLALRMPQMLTVICLLAQVPFIHFLASCDTVNAFLGVSQSQALQLRFCWTHCPTFRPYRQELKWIPGIYGDETKTVTQKSSLKYVLQSLTGNARKAFALLGHLQLKQMKAHSAKKSKEAYPGVKFQELAKECREKFIAHSDENLRTLLVEFFDHKLIRQTAKGRHIENGLLIELDIETLEEVISEFV